MRSISGHGSFFCAYTNPPAMHGARISAFAQSLPKTSESVYHLCILNMYNLACAMYHIIVNATRNRLGLSMGPWDIPGLRPLPPTSLSKRVETLYYRSRSFEADHQNSTPLGFALAAGFLEQASGDAFPFDCGRSKRIIRTLIRWASPLPPPSLELPSRPSLHACGRAKRV